MKNLLIIVFPKINNHKIEDKKKVYKTIAIMSFASVAFGQCVALFAFASFGHSSCGWMHLEFSKLEEKKKTTMRQIKK